MYKSTINIVSTFLFLITASCNNNAGTEKHVLTINNAGQEQLFVIKLKKTFDFQAMRISENSLNDTCMIGLMKVPPGKTGRLYSMEFMSDSISYKYFPYRAKSGSLTIEHSFFD